MIEDIVIEIPSGTSVKLEEGYVDRMLPFAMPCNYGFIEGTVAPDGDPVDVVILNQILGVNYKIKKQLCQLVAVIDLEDNGEIDPKEVYILKDSVQGYNNSYLKPYTTLYRLDCYLTFLRWYKLHKGGSCIIRNVTLDPALIPFWQQGNHTKAFQ